MTDRISFRRFLMSAAVAALCALSVRGQNITGTILGMVKDASGAVISGAEVTVLNIETNHPVKVTTSPLGIFEAPYLRPGRYQVKVSGPGFKTAVRDNIDLQVESRLRLDFSLELG